MRKLLTAIALSLIFAAPTSAATIPVTTLTGDWEGSNATMSAEYVTIFSPSVADNTIAEGLLAYHGNTNQLVTTVYNLTYTVTWEGQAPYLYMLTDTVPTATLSNPIKVPISDATRTGEDRYNFISDKVNATLHLYANANIKGLSLVSPGSLGSAAHIIQVTINDQTFKFGTNTSSGDDGTVPEPSNGGDDPGDDPPDSTPVVNNPPPYNVPDNDYDNGYAYDDDEDYGDDDYGDEDTPAVVKHYVGRCKRTLHVSKRKGERFVSARATMRGKKLHVKGRTITVNLSKKPVGKYNVKIVAKYRKHGHMHIVKSTRHMSVKLAK